MSLTPAARNAGSNDLFFTFSGAGGFLFNINWFNFNGDSPAASPGPVNPAPVPAPIAGPVNPVPAPVNPTPDPQPAPGGFTQRIQAENFVAQSGVLTQATTDTGGGDNVGFINNGDSAAYLLDVPASGSYRLALRVASLRSPGTITLTQGGNVVATVDTPVTGGWQNRVTIETTAQLPSGTDLYDLEFTGDGGFLFNVNWFEISAIDLPVVTLQGGSTSAGQ